MASEDKQPAPSPSEYYEVRPIPGKGFGCFALKPIKRGTRILADEPLLIVPKARYLKADIEAAFEPLSPEQKELYFSLHSGHNQDPKQWPSQVHAIVEEKERQRIAEQHEARLSKSPSLISIFQTNCMEWNDGAAVYVHAARFNHSCNPNACFHWNEAIGKETVHVMNDVAAGDEITLSYCDQNHDTRLRAWELKHYGFTCDCRACGEDEDDESTFAYQSAARRYRLMDLERETCFLRGPRLKEGAKQPEFVNKLLQLAALYQEEGNYTSRLASIFMDIALLCEASNDLGMAKVAAEKAVQVKKDCQGSDSTDFKKYTEVLERVKMRVGVKEAR